MKLTTKIITLLAVWSISIIGLQAQNVAGVYQTDFNEMTLQQNGSSVTGTYKHSNGRIEGTLSGNTMTGWWYQSNAKGRFTYVFNGDFSAFTGKWSYDNAEPANAWNGKKISGFGGSGMQVQPQISVSGTYTTDFNEMTLLQNGTSVTGNYKHAKGRIEGTLNGHTLTGWWYQSNAKGRFTYVFNGDFSAFTGNWSYDNAEPANAWNGKRISGYVGSELQIQPQISVAGVYDTDFNELTLQQNGSSVTGNYKHANGRIEGTLSGNTMTGWWYQSNAKGRFTFVFNSNLSGFTGKWSYNEADPVNAWNGKKK